MECKFSAKGGQNELGVRIKDQEIPKSYRFHYLGSILQKNEKLDGDLNHIIQQCPSFQAELTNKWFGTIPNQPELQTTRSWDFMGFNEKINRSAIVESDDVVGVIDSGIAQESASFRDEGFGPPPMKSKGACKGGQNFTCNNKLVGARFYIEDSARDASGHGTHTASTAAGNAVKDVSFYGLAQGTARGGVPAARIAAYEVCTALDIITISISVGSVQEFYGDPVAIGAFHAMEKGILTANSAGNTGPLANTVSSLAPWILTVAASSIDRRITDKVVFGNGTTVLGNSVNTFTLNGTSFPLVHGKNVSSNCTEARAGRCEFGCLHSGLVKGKIVLCDQEIRNREAYDAGALGSVLYDFRRVDDFSLIFPLAATTLHLEEYGAIISYMNSTSDPRGTILKSEHIIDSAAPCVATFSSRGPNKLLPDIIKPGISAPGVQILAAYLPDFSVCTVPEDQRRAKYNIMSGTSMPGPHTAGVAAYVKSLHPDWSPAAIKSSLMTTALPMNDTNTNVPSGEFGYGSGHINPVSAIDPGLVYVAFKEDYINLLCSIYDEGKGSPRDHNYPSMGAKVEAVKPFTVDFERRVKNVGLANSTYKAKIFSYSKFVIKVTFNMTVVGSDLPNGLQMSAALVWFDGTHNVRSPIVVYTS
ncbi:unnamed protein product [Malus baccata var. baccata]